MNKIILLLTILFPFLAKAQTTIDGILDAFSGVIGDLVIVLAGIALVVFIWGVIKMLLGMSAGDADAVKNGKKHMMWGIIALFVMLSVWGIVALVGTMLDVGTGSQSVFSPAVNF